MPRNDYDDSPKLTRRQVVRGGVLAAVGLGSVSAIHTFLWEPSNLEVSHSHIEIADLAKPFHGFKIAVLSDFHFGMSMTEEFAKRAATAAMKESPDLIVLPGDFVHGGFIAEDLLMAEALKDLAAPYGVLGTFGNHDHWGNLKKLRGTIEKSTPFRMLMNEKILIEKDREALAICGTDDLRFGNYQPERALGGIPEDVPRIMLQHQPDAAEELGAGWRVDLQISGHMHGGQLAFMRGVPGYLPSRYGQKFVEGLVQGKSHRVFVTRGIGGHLPGRPRMFCRPEVSILHLIPSQRPDKVS